MRIDIQMRAVTQEYRHVSEPKESSGKEVVLIVREPVVVTETIEIQNIDYNLYVSRDSEENVVSDRFAEVV